jgi:hypothetical protein
MSDKIQRIHEHAYHLWEKEGRPNGRHLEHWTQAESEVGEHEDFANNHQVNSNGSDPHGIHAAEEYNHNVQETVQSGKSDAAAKEAKRAVEGPERESLKRAEETGKRASKGDDAAGKR